MVIKQIYVTWVTDSFIINIKTEDVCKDISNDFEEIIDLSNYETERTLPILKNKVIGINERWI